MKKLRYIITLIVSILLLVVTLYALFQTPAPVADNTKIVHTPQSLLDSTVGVVWHDTLSKGQQLLQ
ncbi:MAG: hypothetical protein SF052_22065 [Bacteroidia bacterium]|nr:hypothetical protein [Bacteroidia bacterium]